MITGIGYRTLKEAYDLGIVKSQQEIRVTYEDGREEIGIITPMDGHGQEFILVDAHEPDMSRFFKRQFETWEAL